MNMIMYSSWRSEYVSLQYLYKSMWYAMIEADNGELSVFSYEKQEQIPSALLL